MLLGGAVPGLPQEWGTEDADDAQVEDEAEDQDADSAQERRCRSMSQ